MTALALLFAPSAVGLLLMAAAITLDTWTGGREWNAHETKELK
jgi:hypothetical protein